MSNYPEIDAKVARAKVDLDEVYAAGHDEGHTVGYAAGHDEGHTAGYAVGHDEGHTTGLIDGHAEGLEAGYAAGLEAGMAQGSENAATSPTNILPRLMPLVGLTNDGTGLYYGKYATSSSPYYANDTNCTITGQIPCTKVDHPAVYIKGVNWDSSSSHSRVLIMKNNGVAYTVVNVSALGSSDRFKLTTLATNYYKLEVLDGLFAEEDTNNIFASIVLSFDNTIGSENIIIAYEPIEDAVSGGIATYVKEEAERVAAKVHAKQNANTFSFLAFSDAHYLAGNSNIEASIKHAGQGMDLVRTNVNVDFAVNLGDNGWGSGVEGSENRATIDKGLEEIRATNVCIDGAFRGLQNFRAVGNHDSLIYNYTFNGNDFIDAAELFLLYGVYNRGAEFQSGERERGYCYRDFQDRKLRVLCLNTSDLQDLAPADNAWPTYVSGTQGKWFAEALDLSGKNNAAEWSILILSHAPLDWGSAIYLCDILKAYTEGGSGSVTRDGVTISYNYAGKNAAAIIGNCHGHNHNFKVDNLRRLIAGTTTTEAIGVKRFCIPNACFDRSNERGENGLESGTDGVYDIEYGEATTYKKVAGTAQDTAFCVVTVDVVARTIYADCYGAGIDRIINY